MSAGHANPVPCRSCGKPHGWTHEHGWKAYDDAGKLHAYDKTVGEPLIIGRPRPDGNETALFGALEKCGHGSGCKALIEPGDAESHERFHSHIDEVIEIAWRLAGQHGDDDHADRRAS